MTIRANKTRMGKASLLAILGLTTILATAVFANGWEQMPVGALNSYGPTSLDYWPGNPLRIFVGTYGGGQAVSNDGGVTWGTNYGDFYIEPGVATTFVQGCVFDPDNPTHGICLTLSGSYESYNGGLSWTRQSFMEMPTMGYRIVNAPDGIHAACTDIQFGKIWIWNWDQSLWERWTNLTGIHYDLSYDAGDPAGLYAASGSYFSQVTWNHGETWLNWGCEAAGNAAFVMQADPEIPGQVLASGGGQLYRKLGGRQPIWFAFGEGLPGDDISCLIHDPVEPDHIYMGTFGAGVLFSSDRGENWEPLAAGGLNHDRVVDLRINPDDPDYLWAAAHAGSATEGGVYRLQIREGTSVPVTPATDLLLSNYPNPFNPDTEISFQLPAPGRTTVSLYDTSGHLLRLLVDNELSAGPHRLSWDGRDEAGRALPSGIYLCNVSTETGTVASRRLTLLK